MAQTLSAEQSDLDFSLVQPTAMFGRAVQSKPLPQPSAYPGAEPIHQRLAGVSGEGVHYQMDRPGRCIADRDLQQVVGKLRRGARRRDFGEVPPRLRLHATKNVGRAVALVLAIRAIHPGRMGLPGQTSACSTVLQVFR